MSFNPNEIAAMAEMLGVPTGEDSLQEVRSAVPAAQRRAPSVGKRMGTQAKSAPLPRGGAAADRANCVISASPCPPVPLTRWLAEAPDPLFKTVVNVRHVTPIEKLTRAPLAIWTPDELARAARLDDADDGREQPE